MKYILPFIILSALLLPSCRNESTARQLIEQAEQVATNNPDSAYLLLDSVSLPDDLSDKWLARWCMLSGQTADKLLKDMPYVSQLLRARKWYQKYGTPEQQAWIGLYLGRSYVEDRLYMQATDAYSEALNIARKGKAFNAAGYICSYMADLYEYNGMEAEERRKYEEAADYFKEAGNTRSYAFALRDIAKTWVFDDSCSLALQYMLEADSIVTSLHDSIGMGTIANGLGNIYSAMGEIDKAKVCLLRSLSLDSIDLAPNYSALSSLYLNNGEFDSARYYAQKAHLPSKNRYTPVDILYIEYLIEKEDGNNGKALFYLEQYKEAKDSLYDNQREVDILDAEKRYNQLLLLNENSELRISKLFYIVLFSISIVSCLILYLIYQIKDKRRLQKINEQQLFLEQKENRMRQLNIEMARLEVLEKDKANIDSVKAEREEIRIEVLRLRCEKLQSSSISKKVRKAAQKVVAGADKSPLTDKDWHSMVDTIDMIYVSLSAFLHDNRSKLSQGELRYCYLSLLGLSNSEESILLNINPESVNKTRLRVRQKLHLAGNDTLLYDYLVNL